MRVDQAGRLRELEQENTGPKRFVADLSMFNAVLKEVSPAKRGQAVKHTLDGMSISDRRACWAIEPPRRQDNIWSYAMAMERTSDGRPLCILAVIVEYGWEWPSLYGARRIRSGDVSDGPSVQFLMRGLPEHILSDNRPEFAARAVRKCLNQLDVTRLFIEPRSPWEFGYVESFIGKLRDELLTGEGLDTPDEAKVLAKAMRTAYNRLRLHSSRGYAPPAPDAYVVGNVALGPVKCNETGQNNRPMSI